MSPNLAVTGVPVLFHLPASQPVGQRFDQASAQIPLLIHEPYRKRGIEQKREIELDQEIEPNLARTRDRLREPASELGPAR